MEVEKGIYQELKCEIYFLKRKEKKISNILRVFLSGT